MSKPVRARASLQKPRARVCPVERRHIRRRATRRKQIPHVLKHLTLIIVGVAIALLVIASTIHSSTLTVDAIVVLVFCVVVDGLALALQR